MKVDRYTLDASDWPLVINRVSDDAPIAIFPLPEGSVGDDAAGLDQIELARWTLNLMNRAAAGAGVWCVVIEWAHPADGSAAEVYAVCDTEARAKQEEQRAIDYYSGPEFNHRPYFNPATEAEEEDWDFATEVCERTVIAEEKKP